MNDTSGSEPAFSRLEAEQPNRSRRAALGLLAGTVGAAFFPRMVRAANTMDPMAVRLDWSPHAMHCSFHLATEKGWFKNAGLDMHIEDGNGSTTTVQLVAGSGNFDVGHAALAPMAIGRGAGLQIISVAGFLRKGDMGILIDKKLNVKKLDDLKGKKIDYTAGSLEGPFVEPFFTLHKIPVDEVKLLNVDASAKLSSYVSGAVDGIITSVPTYTSMLKNKRPVDRLLFADYGLNLPGFGLIVRPQTLKTKGDAVKRVTSVLCSTWTYIFNGHEDEAARALLSQRPNAGLSHEEVVETLADYKSFFVSDNTRNEKIGLQSSADWIATIKAMESAKVIPTGSKPDSYYTNAYIDYAMGDKLISGA